MKNGALWLAITRRFRLKKESRAQKSQGDGKAVYRFH